MVICLERGADFLLMVQLIPLPSPNPIISCLIYIQTGFSSLVPAHPGCPLNGCSSSIACSVCLFVEIEIEIEFLVERCNFYISLVDGFC